MLFDPSSLLKIVRAPLLLAPRLPNAAARAQRRYNRDAAVAHAQSYWDKYCCDGYCAVTAAPSYREVQPGIPFKNAGDVGGPEEGLGLDGKPIPHDVLDDCSHFTSCCIGRPYDASKLRPMLAAKGDMHTQLAPRIEAGGWDVRAQEGVSGKWVYGKVGAPQLVKWAKERGRTIVRNQPIDDEAKFNEILDTKMDRGDLIAINEANKGYSHVMLYIGSRKIACHSRCRWHLHWRIKLLATTQYTFIHLNDEITG